MGIAPTTWRIFCGLYCCLFVGCHTTVQDRSQGESTTAGTPTIYVVNYPLQYLAKRIGGEHVEVVFPVPAGEDPAFWRPDANTVSAFQAADVILLNGARYAKWIDAVTLPESKLVDTSAAFADQYITLESAVTHSHGPGEHAHEGTAFTTWLDPQLASLQAKTIAQALARVAPQHEHDFQRNLALVEDDLNALDQQLQLATQDHHATPLLYSHPVYQYLQRRYQLHGRSVHWEPEEPPTETMWEQLQTMLNEHPATWMLWEGPPTAETEKRLQALGVRSVVYAPCGNRPDQGDFLERMQNNVAQLAAALAEPTPPSK